MNKVDLERSVGRLDQVASVQHLVSTADSSAGMRLIDIRMWDGVDVQLLPDRGFDIGRAWYRGVPVSWASRLGYQPALSPPLSGADWITRFGGGLVTTCGLFNVGAPSEGQGQHGNFSHLRADDVRVTREVDDAGQVTITAAATIREGSALGPLLELQRLWTLRTGDGTIDLCDRVTNLGDVATPAPILYHVNFGAPFWAPGAWLEAPAAEVVPRDDDARGGISTWNRAPELVPHAPEWAFEHVLHDARAYDWASFEIHSPDTGIHATVSWDTSTLPRVHQWVHPASTINALGIEPANCTVRGRGVDRAEGRLPTLEPDESRTTRLSIRFGPDA
jgi:hypothetical protein